MSELFTIHQVSKSCGLSRSTILRMEDRGLLKPTQINSETGYRYYSLLDITRILHIAEFLDMGMDYDDAHLYYTSNGKSPEILERLEARIEYLQQTYNEMKLRMADNQAFSLEIIRLPEYVCYAREYEGDCLESKQRDMAALFDEAIRKGYQPKISQSIFTINKADFMGGSWNGKTHRYVCCIPVEPECANEHTTVYPACQAVSLLCYGNYKTILQAQSSGALGKCFEEFGLKAAGHPRGISLVGPHTGVTFQPENFVSRIVVPIEPISDSRVSAINRKLAERADGAEL